MCRMCAYDEGMANKTETTHLWVAFCIAMVFVTRGKDAAIRASNWFLKRGM